jgi:hypothetical protein
MLAGRCRRCSWGFSFFPAGIAAPTGYVSRLSVRFYRMATTFSGTYTLDLPGNTRWIARSVAAVNKGYSAAAVHQGYLVLVRKEGHHDDVAG